MTSGLIILHSYPFAIARAFCVRRAWYVGRCRDQGECITTVSVEQAVAHLVGAQLHPNMTP